ncbi:hypothetical protein GCM10017786_36020 [Amycolatopsis deserti]|uniref:DUF3558 domain-containing protein n=1 Tax=Amycolatopsis deserti TaxID=185696 RepID=A0ABQ3J0K5_9PSEU|nr:hypothetical protein [Amycolatopsis deserti]GHE99615.1 hypothetical protein GCM10017786_36020 [Amycolatopsis deserti]
MRAFALAGVAAALAVTVAGCEQSREYAVPERVCGVPVDPAVLAPLLPGGEQIADRSTDLGAGSGSCRVEVDNSTVLYLGHGVAPRDWDVLAEEGWKLANRGNPTPVAGVGKAAAVANDGAQASAECTYEGEPRLFVGFVGLERAEPVPEEIPARRDALVAFLKAWLPVAATAAGCVA